MDTEIYISIRNRGEYHGYETDFNKCFPMSPGLLFDAWQPINVPSDNLDPFVAALLCTPEVEMKKVVKARANAKEIILRHIGSVIDEWLEQFDKVNGYNKEQQRQINIPYPTSMKSNNERSSE